VLALTPPVVCAEAWWRDVEPKLATATYNKKATKTKLNAKILVEPAPNISAFFLEKAKNELNAENFIESPMVTGKFGGAL